jgi:transposase
MSHANAALTPRQRLRVARLVIDHGWPVSRVAEQFNCSWPTAKRWATRYAAMGEAGMADRSSRPHRVANRTPQQLIRKVVHLRWKQRRGRSRSERSCPCHRRPCTRFWSGAG